MQGLSPRELVAELDRFIVGQHRAKRAVAIALRNRERRRQLPADIARDVMPKNIMMIGPTGVGKTEIARRVAEIIDAPFIKVEATKYTEAGYVGRDVESIVSDLAEVAVLKEHDKRLKAVEDKAKGLARDRIVGYLMRQAKFDAGDAVQPQLALGTAPSEQPVTEVSTGGGTVAAAAVAPNSRQRGRVSRRRRELVIDLLAREQLEDQVIEIEVTGPETDYGPVIEFASGMSADEIGEQFDEFMSHYRNTSGGKRKTRKVSVKEARRILEREEANKLIDYDDVIDDALDNVEETGIVFIDEIDKLIGGGRGDGSNDVSGEGVQRDLLPIVEGSSVMTRYGPVKTDYMLFISAGSFFRNRPSELIPELQGRFPIRVDLDPLSREDMLRILTEPENALPRQASALLETEGVRVEFSRDGLEEIASVAWELNDRIENIGARRLEMVMERVMDEISFEGPDLQGQTVVIDRQYVAQRLADVQRSSDLSKYIL